MLPELKDARRFAAAGSVVMLAPMLVLPGPAGGRHPAWTRVTATPVTTTRVVVAAQLQSVPAGTRVVVTAPGGTRLGSARTASDGRALVPVTTRPHASIRLVVHARGVSDAVHVSAKTTTKAVRSSRWMIVNKHIGIGRYAPKRLGSSHSATLDRRVLRSWNAMVRAAARDGIALWSASSYRSYDSQRSLFGAYAASDGASDAQTFSARPGHSEHQTGLALDVASGECTVRACFAHTRAGRWVAAHAAAYGFVVRYPEGEQQVTGYIYEPWHLRYVGPWLAGYLRSSHTKTLEQAFGLPAAPSYPTASAVSAPMRSPLHR